MADLPMRDQVALIAGASKGIGAATAEAFAAAGAAVVLGARDTAALEAVAKRIEAGGGKATAVRTDVTDAESMRNLSTRPGEVRPARCRVQQRHRRPDAGAPGRHRHRGVRPGHRHQHPRHVPRDEVPDPRHARSGGGAIVNMASIAGCTARPTSRVRRGQGRDHRPDQGRRARLRGPGHPGQRGGARADPHPPPRRPAGRRPSGWPGCRRRCGGSAPPPRLPPPCCGSARRSPRSSPGPCSRSTAASPPGTSRRRCTGRASRCPGRPRSQGPDNKSQRPQPDKETR